MAKVTELANEITALEETADPFVKLDYEPMWPWSNHLKDQPDLHDIQLMWE